MKQLLLKIALSLSAIAGTAFVSTSARATTYYVSDCQSGASAGCTAGSSANNGTSASTPKQTFAQVPALVAGDQVLFARGGSWTNAAFALKGGTSATSPIIIDAYSPTWGGTAKPLLNVSGAGVVMLQIWSGIGYTVRNLRLQGAANDVNSRGVFIYTNNNKAVTNVTIDSLEIDQAGLGVYCASSSSTIRPDFVTIKNSTITNGSYHGVLSDCDDLLVDSNTLDNNGTQAVFHHNIYLDGVGNRNTLSNNTLSRSAFISGACAATDIEVEGTKNTLAITGNTINESTGAGSGCWGIEVTTGYAGIVEGHYNVSIAGNRVLNVGNTGIRTSSCNTCTIENNVIAWTAALAATGISTGSEMSYGTDPDAGDSKVTVRNNSIYFTNSAGGSNGIRVGADGPNDTVVVSNLIYYAAGTGANCFDTTGAALGHFLAFNNNLCYHATGTGNYSDKYATLAAAQAAGFDSAGNSANPGLSVFPTLANRLSMALVGTTSPAYNAGNTTYSAKTDINGVTRDAQPDIGAYEFSVVKDTVPPSPPGSVIIQ